MSDSLPNSGGPVLDPEDEAQQLKPPEARTTFTSRFSAAGMPAEQSKDFRGSTARLIAEMRPERAGAVLVLALAVVAVTLFVLGPKILGQATNVIVAGLGNPAGIDYTKLHRTLIVVAGLYLGSATLSYLQGYLLAGVVQRTMMRLRARVEDKLNRLPLRYVDGQPRGDLLSRVTNDIDNVAQSLQQTLSQMLTSVLTHRRRPDHDVHDLLASGPDRAHHHPGIHLHHEDDRQALEEALHRRNGHTPAS